VTDAVRGILDGHIVLSRTLANFNHYPAVDVLESVSRLSRDICSAEELECAAKTREHLALYRKNEDLVAIGAYQKGSSPGLDQAIALHEPLRQFLRQSVGETTPRAETYARLKKIVSP
jgi:flagellum-specific ATP synthase